MKQKVLSDVAEHRLFELKKLLQQFSPQDLEPWIDFVREQFKDCKSPEQKCFIIAVLGCSQKLYAANFWKYLDKN